MSRAAAAGLLFVCGLAAAAAAQTPPAPQPLMPPTHQPQQTAPTGQTAAPDQPHHWFYDMLKKSDARHLTVKKPPKQPSPAD